MSRWLKGNSKCSFIVRKSTVIKSCQTRFWSDDIGNVNTWVWWISAKITTVQASFNLENFIRQQAWYLPPTLLGHESRGMVLLLSSLNHFVGSNFVEELMASAKHYTSGKLPVTSEITTWRAAQSSTGNFTIFERESCLLLASPTLVMLNLLFRRGLALQGKPSLEYYWIPIWYTESHLLHEQRGICVEPNKMKTFELHCVMIRMDLVYFAPCAREHRRLNDAMAVVSVNVLDRDTMQLDLLVLM